MAFCGISDYIMHCFNIDYSIQCSSCDHFHKKIKKLPVWLYKPAIHFFWHSTVWEILQTSLMWLFCMVNYNYCWFAMALKRLGKCNRKYLQSTPRFVRMILCQSSHILIWEKEKGFARITKIAVYLLRILQEPYSIYTMSAQVYRFICISTTQRGRTEHRYINTNQYILGWEKQAY